MPGSPTLSLNRIISPRLPLRAFLNFTADLGIEYVELRNDLTEVGIVDGLPDATLKAAFSETGIRPLTINALYPFEDASAFENNVEKLKGLTVEAKRINCPQIVMCPLNEAGDR